MKSKDEVVTLLKDAEELKARCETVEKKLSDAESAREKAEKEAEELKTKALNFPTSGNSYGTDEARAMRAFGANSVKELIHINTGAPQFASVDPMLKHTVRRLKEAVDVARFTAQMFHGAPTDTIGKDANGDRVASVKNILETYYGRTELAPRLKAFGTSANADFIPTLISSTYIPEFELELGLQSRFREIKMPSNPYDLPVVSGVLKAERVLENAAASAREFASTKLRFDSKKFSQFSVVPEELNEDSAVDFLSLARQEILLSHARAIEWATIQGDDDGSHIDADTQLLGSTVAEKAWKGLRRLALANSANGGTKDIAGPLTYGAILGLLAKMGKFGVAHDQLLIIVGPKVYQQLMGLEQVATADKYGVQAATVLRGSLSAIAGCPVLVSSAMREDLNAQGVYDGVTATKGSILVVNTSRFYYGMRRAPQIRVMQDLPNYDRWLLAAYQRIDFVGHAQGASETSVCYGVNITL